MATELKTPSLADRSQSNKSIWLKTDGSGGSDLSVAVIGTDSITLSKSLFKDDSDIRIVRAIDAAGTAVAAVLPGSHTSTDFVLTVPGAHNAVLQVEILLEQSL